MDACPSASNKKRKKKRNTRKKTQNTCIKFPCTVVIAVHDVITLALSDDAACKSRGAITLFPFFSRIIYSFFSFSFRCRESCCIAIFRTHSRWTYDSFIVLLKSFRCATLHFGAEKKNYDCGRIDKFSFKSFLYMEDYKHHTLWFANGII